MTIDLAKLRAETLALMAALIGSVPAANWMIGNVGDCSSGPCVVPVGLGLHAPSGVLLAGLALVVRDALHEAAGLRAVVMAVLAGAFLSLAVAPPALAAASTAAFLVAEAVDTAGYAVARRWGRAAAVAVSGVIGAAADSFVFLTVAFGTLGYFAGNTLGKLYATVAVAAWLAWRRA